MSDTLTIVGRLVARAGQEAALRDTLLAVAAASRQEPGCLNYDLHINRDDPGRFLIYENWATQAALDDHFQQPYLTAFADRSDTLLAQPLAMERLQELTQFIGRKEPA